MEDLKVESFINFTLINPTLQLQIMCHIKCNYTGYVQVVQLKSMLSEFNESETKNDESFIVYK